jgi:serine protease AprX
MRQDIDIARTDVGRPGQGERRNALWGGRRSLPLVLALAVVALAALAGRAEPAAAGKYSAFVPAALIEAAESDPDGTFDVIVQGADNVRSAQLATVVGEARNEEPEKGARRTKGLKRLFTAISGTSAELTGKQIVRLAKKKWVLSITPDSPTGATYSNTQSWVAATESQSWSAPSTYSFPTIAIVDSGVQPRADFGTRLKTQVSFVSSGQNSSGDGFGHGTLVASIAAGGKAGYDGMAPQADIVSLDVLNDAGAGVMSDAIAACDWILANKAKYNIRVANFSLNAGSGASVLYDPLDRAVERLWLNGVVVVAAAGNYGTSASSPSGVLFAPANDPFVITVGADDMNGTTSNSNDFAAPWSAWGYTYDGFFKPEISAPGRRMTAAVPATSTLATLFPSRKTGSDYMWMSGTSFAAPVVSGAAAFFLAKYPDWTPDQVKGALLLDVDLPSGYSGQGALGFGVIDADGSVGTSSPPNPNAALYRFVTTSSATGLKTFDAASWSSAAAADASWASASWSSASWSSASWSSASWASASWSSASWASASWASASWASASWASASWASSIAVE